MVLPQPEGPSRHTNSPEEKVTDRLSTAGDFTFHDLRHCVINNLRLAGNDHFVIKRASGHKTDSAFQRYNLVTEDEMKGMKWLDEKEEKSGTIDTYLDTMLKLKRTQIELRACYSWLPKPDSNQRPDD